MTGDTLSLSDSWYHTICICYGQNPAALSPLSPRLFIAATDIVLVQGWQWQAPVLSLLLPLSCVTSFMGASWQPKPHV